MKKHRKLLMLLVLSVIFVCLFATPAFAITEKDDFLPTGMYCLIIP